MQITGIGCRESEASIFTVGAELSRVLADTIGDMALIDLQFNYPILSGQRDALSRHIEAAMAESTKWMELPPYGGYAEHREVAAEWLSRGGAPVESSRVMLSAGGHNGVMASLLSAGLSGKRIATDPMTYPGFKRQAAFLGSPLVPCAGDQHGMRPEVLDRAASEEKVEAVYLMANVHNPLGIVIPIERRREICEVAKRRGLIIIDDDAYGFCEAKPPENFATLAPERSYFIHSFTKPYAPAMKLAFVAFPDGQQALMGQALDRLSSGAPALFADVAARVIRSGEMEVLLAEKREEAVARQKIATKAFAGLKTTSHPTSFHVWIELEKPLSAEAVAAALEGEGVLVSPASGYVVREDVKVNGLRVALGAVRDLATLEVGLARVREEIDRASSHAV